MKTLKLFAVSISMFYYTLGMAQGPAWTEGFARADGRQEIQGFKVSWQQANCGNEAVVFLKMSNSNNYPIEVLWKDALIAKESGWIYDTSDENKKSITIPAGSTVTASCDKKENGLIVRLSKFNLSAAQLKYYSIQDLNIVKK